MFLYVTQNIDTGPAKLPKNVTYVTVATLMF